MSKRSFFITGTDTGIGKTWVSLGLMLALQRHGWVTNGMKPVASGCTRHQGQWKNDDAMKIQMRSDGHPAYSTVNPYAFQPAIAPHIAAQLGAQSIDFNVIARAYHSLQSNADCTVVEGVGGWLVPLGPSKSVADLVRTLDIPVIVVVGLRLGCLNHALLTCESIHQQGIQLTGWVANQVASTFDCIDENVETLKTHIRAPCLGIIPHLIEYKAAAIADRLECDFC